MESVDTLRIYLKLVHTLRNGCTPFLPDINCEGQSRLQNGVVINYMEAKQIFLQIMSEEPGLSPDYYQNLDQPFQEFLEDQIIYKHPMKQSVSQQKTPLSVDLFKGKGKKSSNPMDDKYINIDVFLRICIMEFVKVRLLQIDQVLSAIRILEFNNYCDILYNDFENSVKISLYNKQEKWIEGAFAYLINNLEESFFTREDVVITLLPWIHDTFFTKEYTLKHKAWVYVKELEKLKVLDPADYEDKKKVGQAKPKQSSKGERPQERIQFPKSIVPGIKVLKDPLSSSFILEKNFKIMKSFFSSVDNDLKEIDQLYHIIMEKVNGTRKTFLSQIDEEVNQGEETGQKLET
mmetsp:Transcript_431/g.478  ORF Transcript_431/g.478 Transcript_431/m.478 type:complete len:348 (+) Transcript_431:191-1234(+)